MYLDLLPFGVSSQKVPLFFNSVPRGPAMTMQASLSNKHISVYLHTA